MTDIELIKSKLDIIEVIGGYVPGLKRAGSNFKCNCPFHKEKTPSFMVNPQLQRYKCFGCGKVGDVITFIQEYERVEFPEALRIAAQKAGVELTQPSANSVAISKEKERIIEANTLAAKFYNYILGSHKIGKPGREYAAKRQIDAARIHDFLIGFAPDKYEELKKFLISKGFKEKELLSWGLLVERGGKLIDKFRNRLVQPIFNIKGEIVGFSGRYIGSIKEAPKYLNSPETLVYKKHELLYGLFQAKESMREKRTVILEEGNIDILSSHRVGVKNIVAPLGTAFTEDQARILKRYVDEVLFCFDTDSAGTNALIRGIGILETIELKYKVIDITGFQDPDDLICKKPEEWSIRVENPINAVEYLIKKFSKEFDISTVEGKTSFMERMTQVLNVLKDQVAISHYVKEIAVLLEAPESAIWSKIKSNYSQSKLVEDTKTESSVTTIQKNKLERNFLAIIFQTKDKDTFEIPADFFEDTACRDIWGFTHHQKDWDNWEAIIAGLTDQSRIVLEELLMMDLTKLKDVRQTKEELYKRLREQYLKREILRVRKLLTIEESDENLEELNRLTGELIKGVGG